MKIYDKAILPLGFQANGIACGLKKAGKLDLAMFYSRPAAVAALVATTNKIPAAPVILNARYLKTAKDFHGIIANSGNANAFCGKAGIKDAERMGRVAAGLLGVKKEGVLIASTGVIGRRLAVEKIEAAAPDLIAGLSKSGIIKAKKAIMTTDKFAKEITVKCGLGGKAVTVCAVAKGAGMIAPDMATMLVFILTDAIILPAALACALKTAVAGSFNCITVDGCMSTNDTVICLANQSAGNRTIKGGKDLALFVKALNIICLDLAKKIVRDGEGATKLIRIEVSGARTAPEAKRIALSIANSNLFKTAMFASSLNFRGRVVAAAGAAGVGIKEQELKIGFTPLEKAEVDIRVSVGSGRSSAVIYTSDLTHRYIKINAEYN